MKPPVVFVSYSHDSAEHKKWVLDFATTLRNRGVDAVLDQWDLMPGDDLPHFIETHLETSDFILMICSERYVAKANAGEGGVGYEKMIMTSSLLSKIDGRKIIPVIRQSGSAKLPTFLKSKLYIDFSTDADFEYKFDDLLRALLNAPLYEKPEIGSNPFKPMGGATPDRTSDGVKEAMKAVAACYEGWGHDQITLQMLVQSAPMHRLSLDRHLRNAIEQGLITKRNELLQITPDGLNYLVFHNIIQ